MAETYTVHLTVGEPDVEAATECPTCGFDTLLAFPIHTLSIHGVGTIGEYRACARRCSEAGE